MPPSYIGIYSDENTPIRWVAADVYRDGNPTWSPDGKQIAFIRRLGDGGTPPLALEFEARPWSSWIGDAQTGTAQAVWNSGTTLRWVLVRRLPGVGRGRSSRFQFVRRWMAASVFGGDEGRQGRSC